MNPEPESETIPPKSADIANDLDADLDGESLGVRQEEACSMDEGCTSCQ